MTYSKLENQLEILHELSDDSIVSCFLARDKESAEEYIIRKVPRDLFAESGFERFQNEARHLRNSLIPIRSRKHLRFVKPRCGLPIAISVVLQCH